MTNSPLRRALLTPDSTCGQRGCAVRGRMLIARTGWGGIFCPPPCLQLGGRQAGRQAKFSSELPSFCTSYMTFFALGRLLRSWMQRHDASTLAGMSPSRRGAHGHFSRPGLSQACGCMLLVTRRIGPADPSPSLPLRGANEVYSLPVAPRVRAIERQLSPFFLVSLLRDPGLPPSRLSEPEAAHPASLAPASIGRTVAAGTSPAVSAAR